MTLSWGRNDQGAKRPQFGKHKGITFFGFLSHKLHLTFQTKALHKRLKYIFTHLMITRRAVPKTFDCCEKVFLLYPLTLKLDNTDATLAKHPILWRYCSIETPILEERRDINNQQRETFIHLLIREQILELLFQGKTAQNRKGTECPHFFMRMRQVRHLPGH